MGPRLGPFGKNAFPFTRQPKVFLPSCVAAGNWSIGFTGFCFLQLLLNKTQLRIQQELFHGQDYSVSKASVKYGNLKYKNNRIHTVGKPYLGSRENKQAQNR